MVKLVKKDASAEADFLPNVLRIADIAAGFKAMDLVAYDVRGLTLVADCLLFATVKNEPQLKAVVNGVKDGLKVVGVSPCMWRAHSPVAG